MSLFKNRNKMEDRLKKQLSGLEFKPSDSLWHKINQGLHDDFEKSVANKIEDYQLNPSHEAWDKIASSFPEQPRRRGRLGLLALLVTLIGLSVSATFFLMKSAQSVSKKEVSQQSYVLPTARAKQHEVNAQSSNKMLDRNASSNGAPLPGNLYKSNKAAASTSMALTDHLTPIYSKSSNAAKAIPLAANPFKYSPKSVGAIKNGHMLNDEVGDDRSIQNDSNKVASNTSSNDNPTAKFFNHIDTSRIENLTLQAKPVMTKSAMIDTAVNTIANVSIDNQKISDMDHPTRLMLIADAGINYCYNLLQSPNSGNRNLSSNLALRQSLEIPAIDWSGSFKLSYDLNERWRIMAGIGLLNFSQEFSYNTTTPLLAANGSDRNAVYINPNDSIISGSSNSTRIKYSWTEIPVSIAYKFTRGKKWNIEAEAGLSYAVLSTADAGMINYDNVGILMIRDKSAFPGLVNSWFFTFSPALTYQLNPTISLAIHPSIKTSLNSMIEDNTWLKQYPFMAGLSFSIRKRL